MASDRTEADIETYFDEQVKKHGGKSRPIIGRGWRGCSDRIAAFPYNRIYLVELKRPKDGTIRVHQQLDAEFWAPLGVQKEFLFSCAEVDAFIRRVRVYGESKMDRW